MAARGKHRRPRTNPFITRGAVVAGTGTAALALPLLSATTASAAQPAQAPAAAQAAPQSAQAVPQGAKSLTYTVAKGDTLYRIADRYDVRGGWRKLYKDNRKAVGDNPRLIHPGLELVLKGTKLGTSKKSGSSTKPSTASKSNKTSEVDGTADQTSTATTTPAQSPQPPQSAQSAAEAAPASAKTYANNLDGWIREALDIMAQNGIPGSYDGIYRNIMRESSGNPQAINNWDSNAAKGTPSKGLLQVIDPTFAAYHVPGTANDPFDPVANIVAACNYAAARYGSIDNVNGPY
ncbi:transglycosylase SLT domain-containing protein [Streptomyces phyllanthi]|uniref:LysM peptidoglycan-binding domain-containing protein n=1 Tax=Streptomyces phyllanthi TaxID=1803180 RepID=A0A5N8WE56_9ACTN|nr:transglycosylase SLT domain-containing protein [Streptomyces phyllanthi]MPY45619.1 LysM peptidoglycan-binding domain-containing protein [Streptomyces phyllanthi]